MKTKQHKTNNEISKPSRKGESVAIEEPSFNAGSFQKTKPDVSPFMPLNVDKETKDSYRGWGINE